MAGIPALKGESKLSRLAARVCVDGAPSRLLFPERGERTGSALSGDGVNSCLSSSREAPFALFC